MDQLLTSLRALSLLPPCPSQLLQLLSTSTSDEDEAKEIRDLARVLSLGTFDPSGDGVDEVSGGFGIDRELIEDAVVEMIREFKREVRKMRTLYEAEENLRRQPKLWGKATPLHFLKLRHDSSIRQGKKLDELYRGYRPKLLFSGGPSFASDKELNQLRPPSALTRLHIGQRLEGHCVVARVESPISIYVGASMIVSLPKPFGFSVPLSISHFTTDPTLTHQETSVLLPQGTVIALKEPYFSPNHAFRARGTSGGPGFRIDTPTDVVVLYGPGRSRREAQDWGNVFWDSLEWVQESESAHEKSREAPSRQPKRTDEEDNAETSVNIGVGRASWLQEGPASRCILTPSSAQDSLPSTSETLACVENLLKSNRPGAAWREILSAERLGLVKQGKINLEGSEGHIHELRGDILYRLGAWSPAKEAFADALRAAVKRDNGNLTHKLGRAQNREAEAAYGPSSASTVANVYYAHLASSRPRIDLADWLSPSLKVAQIPGAGRGLVTTEFVTAGTPLLTAKARGASYPSDMPNERNPILRCDFQNGVLSTTTQVRATTNLIHIMIDRPEVAQEILGLTAGPETPDSSWVQAARFEKAIAPLTLADSWHNMSIDRLGPKGGINALYIDEVLRHNAFGPGVVRKHGVDDNQTRLRPQGLYPERSSKGDDPASIGLPSALQHKLDHDSPSTFARSTQPHQLPAILNHSCLPNVSSVFFGDVVITRALRDLREGEEIGHEYVRGSVNYVGRQSILSKHGFVCGCRLCNLDRADGTEALAARRHIFAVSAPAIFSRSDALLRHGSLDDVLSKQDALNHTKIRESLQELESKLDRTYNDHTRGKCRPELREVLERIARHSEREKLWYTSVRYHLRSLESVNAVLAPFWAAVADGQEPEGAQESLESLVSQNLSQLPLEQAPALDVDEAQVTLWRLAELFAKRKLTAVSGLWSRAAYWTHSILIGGGLTVFKDRWGPTSAEEEKTLEWKRAWDLWAAEKDAEE